MTHDKKFFISRVSEDQAIGVDVVNKLRSAGFSLVQSQEVLPGLDNTLVELAKSVCSCDIVIHLISSDTGSVAQKHLTALYEFLGASQTSTDIQFSSSQLRDRGLHVLEQKLPSDLSSIYYGRFTYTQWEAWLGLYFGKQVWSFILPDKPATAPNVIKNGQYAATFPTAESPLSSEEHIELLKRSRAPYPTRIENVHHLTSQIYQRLSASDADSSRPAIITRNSAFLNYWNPHAINLLVEAARSIAEPAEIAEILGVEIAAINALTDGLRHRLPIEIGRLSRLCEKLEILDVSKLPSFMAASNTLEGWKHQLELATGASPSSKQLRRLLTNKLFLAEKEWLPEDHRSFPKLISPTSPEYIIKLQDLYHVSGCRLSPEDMLHAAQADFSSEQWMQRIGKEPSEVSTHLRYSNEWMAKKIAPELLKNFGLNAAPSSRIIRIIEAGVGGGHTIYWLLKSIVALCNKRGIQIPHIEYRGFEIVGDSARSMDLTMRGENSSGERCDFFRQLKDLGCFWPFTGSDFFVENCTAEKGIADLVHSSNLIRHEYQGTVDLFITSYAFHHVSNGQALREYLIGSRDAPRQYTLASESNSTKAVFKESLIEGCAQLCRGFNRQKVLESHPRPSPARVYLSLLEVDYFSEDHATMLQTHLRRLGQPNWSISSDSPVVKYIRDLQLNLLQRVYSLLKPGGMIAIADPDGTSFWNAKTIARDPEIMIANFLSLNALREKLGQPTVGFVFNDPQCAVTVHQPAKGEFDIIEGDPPRRICTDDTDPNLGYILIGRKPSTLH